MEALMASDRSFSIINVDEEKCVGCRICEIVCSLKKEEKINPSRSRIRVESVHSHIDLPVLCRQCRDAPCVEACNFDAIYRNEDNTIIIHSENCTGCRACVEACPFAAIFLNPDTDIAVTCDLCGGEPVCVKYCPTGALAYTPWEESLEAKRGSETALYEKLMHIEKKE